MITGDVCRYVCHATVQGGMGASVWALLFACEKRSVSSSELLSPP
jgi:hypothetical protein